MAATGNNNEKRQFHRIPETVTVRIRKIVYPLTDAPAVEGVGKNISAGGVCFAVPQLYEPGDLLSLEINLAGWQRHKRSYAAVIDDDLAMAPFTAVAKVAWCQNHEGDNRYEIGVIFENIYEDDVKALKKYLAVDVSS